jgi:hypothetical protein
MATLTAVYRRKLVWLGPLTVVAAVLAVAVVQRVAVLLIAPIPKAFQFPMLSIEPLVITAALVIGAVIVFVAVGDMASDPVRTFRRIALAVLLTSFVPNVIVGLSWGAGSWPPVISLALMHLVAWAVTVTMLTRFAAGPWHQEP